MTTKTMVSNLLRQDDKVRLNRNALIFLSLITLILFSIIGLISGLSLNNLANTASREQAQTAASLVRLQLYDKSTHGNDNRREKTDQLLSSLSKGNGVRLAWITRSPKVENQFGMSGKSGQAPDNQDFQVQRDGQTRLSDSTLSGNPGARITVPLQATASGGFNCMQCHSAQENEVLGTLNVITSGEAQHADILLVLVLIALVIAAFVYLITQSLRRIPTTALAVEQAVNKAIRGDFTPPDESGGSLNQMRRISSDVGRLINFMEQQAKRFDKALTRITGKAPVAELNPIVAAADAVEQLSHAHTFKQAILQDQSRFDIYQRLGGVLKKHFSISTFSIYEVNYPPQQKAQLIPVMVNGQRENTCRWCSSDITADAENCRAYRACETVNGVSDASLCNAFVQPENTPAQRYLCIPVIRNNVMTTVLQLVSPADQGRQLLSAEPFINLYLNETAILLENRRLESQIHDASLRDPLTGLNNRRFLGEYVDTLIASVQRKKSHLTLAMVDVDEFRLMNDDYGVEVGDLMLKGIAKVLKQAVRTSDIVIRYGDDHFLIVLLDPAAGAVDQIAEHIRSSVENLKVVSQGIALKRTVSIGLANYPGDHEQFWDAVKAADLAMHAAKQAGRNRVIRFSPEMAPSDN